MSFDDTAKAMLSAVEYQTLTSYIKNDGKELALITANKFFELYINGNSIEQIQELNPSFYTECIQWARVKYNWDKAKEDYINRLQRGIADKVLKAQLEATSLYADIISATVKKHGTRLKKYLQSGDVKDLAGVMQIDNIAQLGKVVEGLQKVTGQDRNIKVTKEENFNLSVKTDLSDSSFGPDVAAHILKIIAEEKRSKERQQLTGVIVDEKATSIESSEQDDDGLNAEEESSDETP